MLRATVIAPLPRDLRHSGRRLLCVRSSALSGMQARSTPSSFRPRKPDAGVCSAETPRRKVGRAVAVSICRVRRARCEPTPRLARSQESMYFASDTDDVPGNVTLCAMDDAPRPSAVRPNREGPILDAPGGDNRGDWDSTLFASRRRGHHRVAAARTRHPCQELRVGTGPENINLVGPDRGLDSDASAAG
jgi:hypothetical protein